jgi:hypothetical protein
MQSREIMGAVTPFLRNREQIRLIVRGSTARRAARYTTACTFDAATRPRDGFQSRQGNLFPADPADAIVASFDAAQRKIDFGESTDLPLNVGDSHARRRITQCQADFVLGFLIHDDLLAAALDAAIELVAFFLEEHPQGFIFTFLVSLAHDKPTFSGCSFDKGRINSGFLLTHFKHVNAANVS